ncbi:hypothetical protein [Cylindrospermum stagnale]|nr:hypothetical protein [Cylindrospermum stagnale]
MALDQSIVFDGGWRVFSGQKPFVDFFTPFGITPYYIQSIFFYFLGVNWYSYSAHSSVLNGLFCVICYFILRHYYLPLSYALFYSVLSAFVFYPPVGTPFLEQHAFFFGIASVLCSIKAISTNKPLLQIVSSALVPIFWFLAYFSKQSPSVFFIPLIISIIFTGLIYKNKIEISRIICAIFSSLGLLIFLLLLIGNLFKIEIKQFIYYFYTLPSEIGKERLKDILHDPLGTIIYLLEFAKPFKYAFAGTYSPGILFSTLLSLLCFYKFVELKSRKQKIIPFILKDKKSLNLLQQVAIIIALNTISVIFIKLTLNEPAVGVPFVFLSLGLTHNLVIYIFENNYLNSKTKTKPIISTVIIVSVVNLILFVYKVDMPRLVNNLDFNHKIENYNFSQVSDLNYLEWQLPSFYLGTEPQEFESLLKYLKEQNNNFFLFGDSSVLYGLSKKPSVNPSILFQYGYGMPNQNSSELNDYQFKVIENMEKYHVKLFIKEGIQTWMGLIINDFSIINNFIKVNKCNSKTHKYGNFKIYPMCYQNKTKQDLNIRN